MVAKVKFRYQGYGEHCGSCQETQAKPPIATPLNWNWPSQP